MYTQWYGNKKECPFSKSFNKNAILKPTYQTDNFFTTSWTPSKQLWEKFPYEFHIVLTTHQLLMLWRRVNCFCFEDKSLFNVLKTNHLLLFWRRINCYCFEDESIVIVLKTSQLLLFCRQGYCYRFEDESIAIVLKTNLLLLF